MWIIDWHLLCHFNGSKEMSCGRDNIAFLLAKCVSTNKAGCWRRDRKEATKEWQHSAADGKMARQWVDVASADANLSVQPSANTSMMANQAETSGCPSQQTVSYLEITLTVVDSVVAMLALMGNGLVIASVIKYPSLRSATNMFVLSLAVADLLVGVCIPYYVLFYFQLDWVCNYWPCLLRYFTVLCTTVASMLANVGVAVDRYLVIVHPLDYPRLIGRWRVPVAITLGWVYVIIITALPLFGLNDWTQEKIQKCQNQTIECDLFYMATYYFVWLAVGFHVLLTLVVTTGLYLRIFRVAWRQLHSVAILQPNPRIHQEARTARMMALVLGVSLLSLAPYLVAILLPYKYNNDMDKCNNFLWRSFKKTAVSFYLAKSSLNPLIYGWKNTEFRSAFCRLLRLPYLDKDMSNSRIIVFSITKLS